MCGQLDHCGENVIRRDLAVYKGFLKTYTLPYLSKNTLPRLPLFI